jgi:hypothetical protein
MTAHSISRAEAWDRIDISMMAWRVHEFGLPEDLVPVIERVSNSLSSRVSGLPGAPRRKCP